MEVRYDGLSAQSGGEDYIEGKQFRDNGQKEMRNT